MGLRVALVVARSVRTETKRFRRATVNSPMKLLSILALVSLAFTAGCRTPVEKLVKIHYEADAQARDPHWDGTWRTDFRDWELGEYKECMNSYKGADSRVPDDLSCSDLTLVDADHGGKVFLVRFVGVPRCAPMKGFDVGLCSWRCRRTSGSDVAFICAATSP